MGKVLKELLNVYWLRPETALWRAIDIEVMKDFKIKGKSLDLGCGDGVLSFIRGGEEFDLFFDDYQSIGNLDKFYDNADVHDIFIESYRPCISKKPLYKFSVALDHKENLLKKAKQLNFYNDFIVHDANQPLPFESNTFDSIFSNIVYWLDDPQKSMNEISRVLSSRGKVALMLPNRTMPEFSFYNQLHVEINNKDFEFLKYIDRGRYSSNIKLAKSYNEWVKIIDNSGLKIVQHKTHLSKTVIQIWDIGLRPLFPVLLKLVQSVENKKKLIEIKQEWIEIFMKFLEPIFELEIQNKLNQKEEKAFHYFVLEK
ncbi:class I SAM-dependent methyltransferase [Aliarcobacter butzleri]|uniref:class I SAM-dependent methyltransferase n=1 Tax=Aliarcobacter butzleri TaxID=28197 RepID=UPI001EDA7E47|nr:class I SAM-dependent methyltransferase [Aliarcobacter butzleri]MCG3685613.1 class I SAM-dependent methyltransferase [Aliarcobacter butzleri]